MKLLDWWQQRQARERQLIASGFGILILLALYLTLEPAINERSRMREQIPQLQTDLLWMQSHASEFMASKSRSDTGINSANNNLSLASVQAIINQLGLREIVDDLRSAPNQSISLNFTEISYADLLELIFQLRNKTGARIQSAEISRLDNQPGIVQALLILAR